ncbi:MAG TPA: hypothetical protein VMU88_00450 [bacterium]|nr:hypothetical protein [bacterium]
MADSVSQVPLRHGEFYFDPPPAQWKDQVLRNRDRLSKETFWGQAPAQVRAALKIPTDRPVIMVGHQPVFFHPGLWAKSLAASVLAEQVGGVACQKLTDTALGLEYLHYLPEVEEAGQSRRRPLEFFQSREGQELVKTMAYAHLGAPEKAAFQKIMEEGKTYAPPEVRENLKFFEDRLAAGLRDAKSWNDYYLYTMGILDELSGTQRLYFQGSKFWSSEPFQEFVAHWLLNLPALTDAYNHSLNEYRAQHQIKHELTPLPNLKFEDWWFELPFWGLNKYHQRHSIWAKLDGDRMVLRMKGHDGTYSISTKDFVRELKALPIAFWPKALPQTLFCRMYLCDYFIHGVGGGLYERVNDLLWEKIFRSKAPDFGVVTATWRVDPVQSAKIEEITRHEERILFWERALSKNPEYVFTRAEGWEKELPEFIRKEFAQVLARPDLAKLAAEKAKCVERLKDASQRAAASKRIPEINQALAAEYDPLLKALEKGLMDIEKLKKVQDVLAFREYPFFAHSPKIYPEMKKKVEEAFGQA